LQRRHGAPREVRSLGALGAAGKGRVPKVSERASGGMTREVRRRVLSLTLTTRLLWVVVAVIVIAWIVLVSIGAATT
jgi:hypothetical protein